MPVAYLPDKRWTERFPLWQLPFVAEVAIALAATAAAAALRYAIGDSLPPGFPFLTFFPAVIVTAFLLGSRTGTLTALFSGLAAWFWFLPPTGSLALDYGKLVAMAFFVFITTTEIALVHWMQRSNSLLFAEPDANARLADTRELLCRELQHRVSNNLQMVAALLSLQRR